MVTVTFRKAERSDLFDIIELLGDDPIGRFREVVSRRIDERYSAAFQAIDEDPNQLMAVAVDDGTMVGCMQLTFIPGLSRAGMWRGQVEGVRIAASHRGTGLGKRFFEWAFHCFKERGCGLVQLTSDKARPDAIRFYETLGFTNSHEGMKLSIESMSS